MEIRTLWGDLRTNGSVVSYPEKVDKKINRKANIICVWSKMRETITYNNTNENLCITEYETIVAGLATIFPRNSTHSPAFNSLVCGSVAEISAIFQDTYV